MNEKEKLEWSALEYEERERGADWFWTLGIIIVASSTASFIFKNYFFGLLIILSGILLGVFAVKKPDTVNYEINKKGLKIKNRLYPFENIKSFWVQIVLPSDKTTIKPILFIKSERFFLPILSIPIEESLAEDIRNFMLSFDVLEEEMKEHPSEKIMDSLGF